MPTGKRADPDGEIDWLDAIGLTLVAFLSVAGLFALVLAQVGWFSSAVWLGATASLTVGVALILWRKFGRGAIHIHGISSPEATAVVALVVLSAALYTRPFEFVFGGADAGVYVNLGANIAKTGALLVQDPLTAELPPQAWAGFLRAQPPGEETDFIRFPGFYLSEEHRGEVIPQFFPLHPVWLAIGYALAGLWGALLLTPLWAVLGVYSVYLFARALFDWKVAFIVAAFLAVTPLQIYFARYPTAESITQYFTWTGIWCFTNYVTYRDPRALWGACAGLALGQVFLARIDALPMLLLPVAWLLILFIDRRWRRDEWWFWVPYVAITLLTVFHALWYSTPYTFNTYRALWTLMGRYWWLAMGLAVLIAAAAFIARMQWSVSRQERGWAVLDHRRVRVALAVGVGVLASYAYFIRPVVGTTVLFHYWYAGTEVPSSDHENLVRLGWYLTPLGIGLATAGAMLLILFGNWAVLWPFGLVGGAFTLLYVNNILNNPVQIYAMRRYVPVVLPTLILTGVYALAWLWMQSRRRVLLRAIAVAAGGLWLAGLLVNGRLIWNQIEYAGVSRQLETLAAQFPKNAVLLFVDPAPVGLGDVLGTPLHFLYDLPAYDLQEEQLSASGLADQIKRLQAAGREPYLIRVPGAPMPLAQSSLAPVSVFHLTYPLLEQGYEHPPSFSQQIDVAIEIYRVPAESR